MSRTLMHARPPNYAEAIAKLKEADALPAHSAFEQHVINETLGFAYLWTRDYVNAVKMLESGLNDGQLDQAEVPKRIRDLAKLYYNLKSYGKVIEFGTRAIEGGYADGEIKALVGRSYYSRGDWTSTRKFEVDLVSGEIKRGETPAKEWLQVLYSTCVKLKDEACKTQALEWLAQYYPTEAPPQSGVAC
jgi:tetratricopeptide (TPR) repeat protein